MREPIVGDLVKLNYMNRRGTLINIDFRDGQCLVVWEGSGIEVSGPYNLHELEFIKEGINYGKS